MKGDGSDIQNNRLPDQHLTLILEKELCIRAVVISEHSSNGRATIDYMLQPQDESYGLTLIQNPLLDYDRAMKHVDVLASEYTALKAQSELYQQHQAHTLWKEMCALWSVAHWYQVDEFADRMTVGMSVAVWLGLKRTHTITIHNVRTI